MNFDPFAPPGGDIFSGQSLKGLFNKRSVPRIGAAGKPKKAEQPAAEPVLEEDVQQSTAEEPAEAKPQVKLFELKWASESGFFEEKIKISVRAELPESLKHVTRVLFSLSYLDSSLKKQPAKTEEAFLKDGLAEAEFVLPQLKGDNGKPLEEGTFACIAKHRDSTELESAPLKARIRRVSGDELVVELEDAAGFKKKNYAFRMKSDDGEYESVLNSKDIAEAKGASSLKFQKLDLNARYTLELLDSSGKVLEKVFASKECGKWK